MSIGIARKDSGHRRWRPLVYALAMAVVGALTLVATSAPASAQNLTCLNYPGASYTLRFDNPYTDPATGQQTYFVFPDGHIHAHVVLVFWIHSSALTQDVAASAFVDNGTDQTAMGTFSTSQSKTFTITETQTTGTSASLLGTTFSQTVSTSVTSSISTSTTITASAPIPPHSRVQGDFGVDAYNVNYDVDYWQFDQNTCWYHGSHRNVNANVPTTIQGWHIFPAQPL